MGQDNSQVRRRDFLTSLGVGAALGTTLGRQGSRAAETARRALPAIPQLTNPNILVIIVDQMRQPLWLNAAQLTQYQTTVIPNITGIYNKAVTFDQYYVAATACTPSRACLMTGLYAPQTAMYLTQGTTAEPTLNTLYPTWGGAVRQLNAAYQNVYWFGKWHLSAVAGGNLAPYGFQTSLYPSAKNPSPNGFPNEGSHGGKFSCTSVPSNPWSGKTLASDAEIAGDFINWLTSNPTGPWCAAVSLINPHDVGKFPYWLDMYKGGCQGPNGTGYSTEAYFNPPGTPPQFYTSVPGSWNYESVDPKTTHKPPLQQLLVDSLDKQFNGNKACPVLCPPLSYPTDFITLLNYYYYLQSLVDVQVGNIMNALASSGLANNTIVVFTSDHGEFCGSHSMRDKGGGVYDEAIRVPLYVSIPGVAQNVNVDSMCSAVDFFGLICDLATGGTGVWRTAYPDLARRESVYNYIYSGSPEQYRLVPVRVNGSSTPSMLPYILHTTDENFAGEPPASLTYGQIGKLAGFNGVNNHVVAIRTKTANNGNNGFKYAVYNSWANCSTVPNNSSSNPSNYEYYDYQDSFDNRGELGNNYYGNNDANSKQSLSDLETQLGTWGTPTGGTNIIGDELNATLTGLGTDHATSLNCVLLETARPAYFQYMGHSCTPPSCK